MSSDESLTKAGALPVPSAKSTAPVLTAMLPNANRNGAHPPMSAPDTNIGRKNAALMKTMYSGTKNALAVTTRNQDSEIAYPAIFSLPFRNSQRASAPAPARNRIPARSIAI